MLSSLLRKFSGSYEVCSSFFIILDALYMRKIFFHLDVTCNKQFLRKELA